MDSCLELGKIGGTETSQKTVWNFHSQGMVAGKKEGSGQINRGCLGGGMEC